MKSYAESRKDIAIDDPRLKASQAFGGILLRKARYRTRRPLSTKRSVHVVLRSSQAKGSLAFQHPKNRKRIEKLCSEYAQRFGIKLRHYGNGSDHLHLIIKIKRKAAYASFIRALTGAIALKLTGANRTRGNQTRFWDFRPFTSLVSCEPTYRLAKDYVTLNFLESLMIIPTNGLLLTKSFADSS